MFDIVEKNKTAVQVVLGLVSLGLVVGVGVGGYSAIQEGQFLAKVGSTKITEREVAEVVGEQLLSEESKASVVEQLVQEALLVEEAKSLRMTASDESLRELIASLPAFQVDGQFDASRYTALLAQQRMTPEMFQEKVKRGLILRQLTAGITQAGFASQTLQNQMEQILAEKREVQAYVVSANRFLKQVTVSADEVKSYYDEHTEEFKQPDQVKLSYLVLSQADLVAKQSPSEAEVKAYFEANKQELSQEERKARHILVKVDKAADAAAKQSAKEKAQAILVELKKNPSSFAEVAKNNSDDSGSAVQGGDLGWFARGAMVPSFDEAVFSLAKGQMSDLVETDFGLHIIQLEDVKAKSFADVKAEVMDRLKLQTAQKLYREQAEKFKEVVYQQADSLEPAAKEFNLAIQKSGWVTRSKANESVLSSQKVLEAAFSEDVLKRKHNSDAIEVSSGVLVAVNVAEHQAEHIQSLLDVSDAIKQKLSLSKATQLAREEAAKTLQALNGGVSVVVKWDDNKEVTRLDDHVIALPSLKAIFKVPSNALPAYVNAEIGPDAVIYRVNKIKPHAQGQSASGSQLQARMAQANGQVLVASYLDALKAKYKVEYRR